MNVYHYIMMFCYSLCIRGKFSQMVVQMEQSEGHQKFRIHPLETMNIHRIFRVTLASSC